MTKCKSQRYQGADTANHTRRDFLKNTGIAAAAYSLLPSCATAGRAERPGRRKPNIIFILADDLGYADLGCYGSKQIKTPNIDKMAAQGIKFTDAYSGCTVCAPARSTLMTGKHMGRTSVRGNTGGIPILPEDVTAAQVLKKAGYATGGFGKWGLGDVGTTGVPEKHGFDEFYGYYHQVHAHDYYCDYLWRNSEKIPMQGEPGTELIFTKEELYSMKVQYRVGDMYAPKLEGHEALTLETEHFVDCLNKGIQPLTGGREGLQVVKILSAAEQSLKNKGTPVELV